MFRGAGVGAGSRVDQGCERGGRRDQGCLSIWAMMLLTSDSVVRSLVWQYEMSWDALLTFWAKMSTETDSDSISRAMAANSL